MQEAIYYNLNLINDNLSFNKIIFYWGYSGYFYLNIDDEKNKIIS